MTQPEIVIKICRTNPAFQDVQFLHKTIWGLDELEITPTHIYLAATHAGGKILCAYANEKPVGYVFGFVGVEDKGTPYFYSHNLGVLKEWRNQGIAFDLKVRLREVLLADGFSDVKWTYEPLDSKNAYAYIGKLGGVSNTYHREYYGEMEDDINRGLPSDRLVVDWFIDSKHVSRKINRETPKLSLENIDNGAQLNSVQVAEHLPKPVDRKLNITELCRAGKKRFSLEIPPNFHDLKEVSPALVLEWRLHVRQLMEACFANDLCITDVMYEAHRFLYILQPMETVDK